MLKLYTCTNHDALEPTGVASIVLAVNKEQAIELLDMQLSFKGLKTSKTSKYPYDLIEVQMNGPLAIILNDGNY